ANSLWVTESRQAKYASSTRFLMGVHLAESDDSGIHRLSAKIILSSGEQSMNRLRYKIAESVWPSIIQSAAIW
ncbi:MAG: hypothetical protein J6Y16_01155, partial [Treponema sp.]|nr:hypothetical protein [Treponema sp.]